jgi:hypothetical protein
MSCSVEIKWNQAVKDANSSLEPQIVGIATQYGYADGVHLVGHSKGGWWIRDMLPHLASDSFNGTGVPGVYSVTTIDTPHHGSSLADLLVGENNTVFLVGLPPTQWLPRLAALFKDYDKSAEDDQQTKSAAATNTRLPDPSQLTFSIGSFTAKARYYSIGSDADLNQDCKINSATHPGDEGFPYPWYAANRTYQFLRKIRSAKFNTTILGITIPIPPTFQPTAAPEPNDMVVTVRSAQYSGFTPINPVGGAAGHTVPEGIPFFYANHKTVGCGNAATSGCTATFAAPASGCTASSQSSTISLGAPAVIAAIQDAEGSIIKVPAQ